MKENLLDENATQVSGKTFHYNRAKNVSYKSHINLETEIVFVSEGELEMEIENKKYLIRKNQGVFVLPFEAHSFSSRNSISHIIMFDRRVSVDFYEFITDKTPTSRLFTLTDLHVGLVEYLTKNEQTPFSILTAQALVGPLIALILEQCEFKKEKAGKNKILYSALKVINENFVYDFSLEEVAKEIDCHPVSLSKAFSSGTGMSFTYYITLRKTYYAKNLLEQTNMTITEIALESGFGCLRSFNRCFKKVFSVTPSEYRNNFLKE